MVFTLSNRILPKLTFENKNIARKKKNAKLEMVAITHFGTLCKYE